MYVKQFSLCKVSGSKTVNEQNNEFPARPYDIVVGVEEEG